MPFHQFAPAGYKHVTAVVLYLLVFAYPAVLGLAIAGCRVPI